MSPLPNLRPRLLPNNLACFTSLLSLGFHPHSRRCLRPPLFPSQRMPQSYEPCFSFSVPPGKPCDPAYADPGPILSSREAGWTRHISTAASSTSSDCSSTTSPFAFSVPSEPSVSQRHSFANPTAVSGSHSTADLSPPLAEGSRALNLVDLWPRPSLDASTPITAHYAYPYPVFPPPVVSPETESQSAHQTFCLQPAPMRKRPRRRYEEIERLYGCKYHGCMKAYGTLNHLNAHVLMQKHGPKRLPEEFKEIRKEWRMRNKSRGNNASGPDPVQVDSNAMDGSPMKKARMKGDRA